ncbi:hypothetical protein FQV39_03195 [Bosea sp. F3-2]|uniref:hypothetical protein n=1 Tax=Bosea sp. F3-2 TaxID=2599640 RepID=UPI0011EFD2E0|nr:hypothetical protein [Bosea sp. F3-2]QEL21695.1 hypothetical protein FQV39_03195 [Bosea sp. F3-2]
MTRKIVRVEISPEDALRDMLAGLRQARVEADLSWDDVDRAARLPAGTCARLEIEIDHPMAGRALPKNAIERIAALLGVGFTIKW